MRQSQQCSLYVVLFNVAQCLCVSTAYNSRDLNTTGAQSIIGSIQVNGYITNGLIFVVELKLEELKAKADHTAEESKLIADAEALVAKVDQDDKNREGKLPPHYSVNYPPADHANMQKIYRVVDGWHRYVVKFLLID
jgi:hypothetical protein